MHNQSYVDKINSLLDDTYIYEISNLITINKDDFFLQTLPKLVKNQKTWISLIKHHPTVPTLYSLPKIYKRNTLLRSIISNIGKIARAIAKILTPYSKQSTSLRYKLWKLT